MARVKSADTRRAGALRSIFFVLSILCVPLGLGTKRFPVGESWIADNLGGTIYVMFFCFLLLALFPRARPFRVGLWVFLATCGVELLQLWHPPFLERVRDSRLGALLLGRSFSWVDFPFYGAGALVAGMAGRLLRGAGRDRASTPAAAGSIERGSGQ